MRPKPDISRCASAPISAAGADRPIGDFLQYFPAVIDPSRYTDIAELVLTWELDPAMPTAARLARDYRQTFISSGGRLRLYERARAMSHEVTIIGAGIVGVSCGLALQAAGCRVRIFDPLEPGMATSFGNAGLISNKTILPNAMPGIWREIPGWLRDPCGPLRLRWTHLPFAAPWLLRFLACSSPGRVRRIADELAPLVGAATAAHQALIADHGIDAGLLRPGGILTLLRDWDGDRSMALEQDLWRRHDIDYEIVGRQAIEAMEPGISADYRFGLYHPGQHFVTEPIALTHAYAQAFRELGGVFLRERVVDIEFGADGPRQLITDVRRHALDRLVLAAGAWSKPLARKLGARVALESERGYHVQNHHRRAGWPVAAVVCRRRALFSLPDERTVCD